MKILIMQFDTSIHTKLNEDWFRNSEVNTGEFTET
jgi:hypothetical protein